MENGGKQICVTKQEVDGFQKLVKLWRKCIEMHGDFVEK